MKKVFLTAFVAAAFAFGMASCNNNNAPEETTVDTTEVCCEHHCQHQCNCPDTACAANHCEGCVNEECCCKKACCEGQHEGCAEQKECCAEKKECCEQKECKKECEQKK